MGPRNNVVKPSDVDDAILRVLSYDKHRDSGLKRCDLECWVDVEPGLLVPRLTWLHKHGFIYREHGRWFVTGGDGR
jgi:hypothetical protein